MSLESGAISIRIFQLPQRLPQDAVERFAVKAAPPLKSMGTEPVHGWTGGRHLLDVPITEENATFGGHLRLCLLKAERKVPAALLKAECKLEEQAHMKAENKPFVDRKTRSEIRKNLVARLLPTVQPSLKGTFFTVDDNSVYCTAVSESSCEAFRIHFRNTIGFDPIPLTAETAAVLANSNLADWGKSSLSPEIPNSAVDETPGADFLTWLWFVSEARGGLLETKNGKLAIAIEGPLLFTRAGEGAHQTTLKDGLPTLSAEAKTALLSGKKLERAKLILGLTGDQRWSCSFDAGDFVFRGLRLPESKEMLDAASDFQNRVQQIGLFRDLLLDLFKQFVSERGSPEKWTVTQKEIHAWVEEKSVKQ
jgi:hypothetical protein